jgi:PncC family amidohydrolase
MNELHEVAARIGELLKARREGVAVAESSSGGLVSAALLSVPGASAYYLGGGVVYTRKARELLMGLDDAAVKGLRSSSEPYALCLAKTARQRFEAAWGVSETGVAGPTGGRYGNQPGHTCIAIAGPNGLEKSETLETASADRLQNMHLFAKAALALLLQNLEATKL